MWRNYASFYGESFSAPRPTPKLKDHPLSAVRDCLFNILAITFHIGGRSSNRNPKTRHAVVAGTLLSWYRMFISMNTRVHSCVWIRGTLERSRFVIAGWVDKGSRSIGLHSTLSVWSRHKGKHLKKKSGLFFLPRKWNSFIKYVNTRFKKYSLNVSWL